MLRFEEWAFNEGRINLLQYVDMAQGAGKCCNCSMNATCLKCPSECLQEDIREYQRYKLSCLGQPANQS